MEVLIIYFSGTGNTELITAEIASRLKKAVGHVETVSVEGVDVNERKLNFKLRTADLLGFGFPVYKFSYPKIMQRIFPLLENLKPEGKPIFVFSTYCRFSSTSLHRMAAAVESASGSDGPVAMEAFKCPSNGIASLKPVESGAYREVMYFEPGINEKLDQFVEKTVAGLEKYIADGSVREHHGSPVDTGRERFVGKIEQARYPELSIDHEACIVCGLCVKRCPDQNLLLDERSDGSRFIKVKDSAGCLHCLRCLHICPKKAVSFGPLVEGPSRYRAGTVKKLFAEAADKAAGSPEPGTRLIRMRWAAGNICYYLSKRR